MPATRNIVSHMRFEVAAGDRACDVSKEHVISPGEKHFAYEQVPGQRKNICMACAPSILAKARTYLNSLAKQVIP